MKTKRIYLSGPITGLNPIDVERNFEKVTEALRNNGVRETIINPLYIVPKGMTDWSDCMDICIAALYKCTTIVKLPGWRQSKGCRVESKIAEMLGMEIIEIINIKQ